MSYKTIITALAVIGVFGFAGVAFALPYFTQTQSMVPGQNDKYNIGTSSPSLLEYNNIFTKDITISGTCTGCGGITSYDAWTHPSSGQSATTSLMVLSGNASTTQLTVSSGTGTTTTLAGNTNIFGVLGIGGTSTTTIYGTATSTFPFGINVLAINQTGSATSTFAHGINIASGGGCFAVNGTCLSSGGTPGGSNTYIQYNDSGSFGGDSNFTWNKTSQVLTLVGDIDGLSAGQVFGLTLSDSDAYFTNSTFALTGVDSTGPFVSSDAVHNSTAYFDTTKQSADRTFTFPDLAGVFALGSYSTGFTVGSIPYGSSGLLATSSALTFDETRLNMTYASSTDVSATGAQFGTLTLSNALGIASGGTGLTSVSADKIIYGNHAGTAYVATATSTLFGTCSGGQVVGWSNTTGGLTCIATSTSSGTVTSVAMSVPTFLSVSGSPITTSGTLAVSYSGTALPIANGGTGTTTNRYKGLFFAGSDNGLFQQASTTGLLDYDPTNQNLTLKYASTTAVTISGNAYIGAGTGLLLTASGAVSNYAGTSCTNQFVRSLSTSGAATCATVSSSDVSLANLTATNSTLTFSGTYNGSTARTIGLNLSNANTWTALQQFANASTTLLSAYGAYFGATATSTFTSTGTLGIGSTTPWSSISISAGAQTFPYFGIGSTTSTLFSVNQYGGIQSNATQPATTTTITLNWSQTPQQVEYQIGTSATTITLINATTSQYWGSRKLVWVCNPNASAGALTWAGVEWIGTAPVQTTTSNQCDAYSFDVTRATSTSAYKVAGTAGTGFK